MGKFERGQQANFPTRTQAQLEKALLWPPGSIESLLAAVEAGDLRQAEGFVHAPLFGTRDEREAAEATMNDYFAETPFDDPDRGRHPAEQAFGRWYRARREFLDHEQSYAEVRGLSLRQAAEELDELFDVATGRERAPDGWMPPWLRGLSVVPSSVPDVVAADQDEDPDLATREQEEPEHP